MSFSIFFNSTAAFISAGMEAKFASAWFTYSLNPPKIGPLGGVLLGGLAFFLLHSAGFALCVSESEP